MTTTNTVGNYRREIDKDTYEYKDRLDPDDNVFYWQRRVDGVWCEYADGYWPYEDYGNPDSPCRSYAEALKHRYAFSKLHNLESLSGPWL